MNRLSITFPRMILAAMALILILGAIPAQAARPNLAPAISLGPLSHREELRATVTTKAQLARVELRIDTRKVQPWVKAHAGFKYSLRYPLQTVAVGTHTAKLTVWDRQNRSTQRQWQFQKLAQLGLEASTTSVRPGETVTLSGRGFTPGTGITVGMGGPNTAVGGTYGSAVTDRSGAFTVVVTLDRYPDGSPLHAGTITLLAHNRDGSEKAGVDMRILPAPRVTVDKTSIKPGDQVQVTGDGFTPGVSVSLSLGAPNGGAGGNYGSTVTDGTGRFSLSVRPTQLPDGSPLPAGPVVLVAHTADSQEKATAQIQILADPSISLDKTAIKAGERVTVSGKGFTPGTSISIALGGMNTGAGGNYGSAVADGSGRFSLAVTLSRYPDGSPLKPGSIVLVAHTADSAEKASAQLQIQADPSLTAGKADIRVGETVTLTGQGFTPGASISISMGPVNGGTGGNYGTALANANGGFSLPVTVARYPDGSPLTPGTIVLLAHTADFSEKAGVQLRVLAAPTITFDRTVIQPGERVLVTGQGFTPGTLVSLSLGGVNTGASGNYGTSLVDTNGRFTLAITLERYPNGLPLQAGTIVLVAHNPAWDEKASAQLQIVDRAPAAPSDLTITSLKKGAASAEPVVVGLQWRDNSPNETGFRIKATFTRLNGGTDTQVWNVAANATAAQMSFVAGGINPISKACFTVTAFTSQGESSPSNEVCAVL